MNTVLTEKIVRTRKPHNCWGCLREFPKGNEVDRVKAWMELPNIYENPELMEAE